METSKKPFGCPLLSLPPPHPLYCVLTFPPQAPRGRGKVLEEKTDGSNATNLAVTPTPTTGVFEQLPW